MLYFLLILIVTYFVIVYTRWKRYKYSTSKDYLYNLEKNKIANLTLVNNRLILPETYKNYDTLFLKISVLFNPISLFLKPFIEIENTKHYFEYGSKGIRYLNISHTDSIELLFNLKNISLSTQDLILYGYNNHIQKNEKILILAPHADDAEISSFGLYKNSEDVTIVTTTIGESGACNYCEIYNQDIKKQILKKAELRTFDALTIPMLGDVNINKCLSLGYFGSSLQWMSKNRETEYQTDENAINDMNHYRRVTHANINLPAKVKPTYLSFLDDLENIIKQLNPSIIITPHPSIDSHEDHKVTTYALIEALRSSNVNLKLLLYTNHLKTSETYPIGPMNSSITLPPNFKPFYFDSIYSFKLDKDLQIDKFFALEAIHDLRDSLIFIFIKRAYKQLSRMIRRKIAGKDKNYYKRAVRANELFFVVNSENIDELIDI